MSFLSNILGNGGGAGGAGSSSGGLIGGILQNSIGLNLLQSVLGGSQAGQNAQNYTAQFQQYQQEGQNFWNQIKDGEIDVRGKADSSVFMLVIVAVLGVVVAKVLKLF